MRGSKGRAGVFTWCALALVVAGGCAVSGGEAEESDDSANDAAGGAGGAAVDAATGGGTTSSSSNATSSSSSVSVSSSSSVASSSVSVASSSSTGGGNSMGTCNVPIDLVIGTPAAGDTTGAANLLDESCGSFSGTGPELVYTLTAANDGTLAMSLATTNADLGISVRTDCGSPGSELVCADAVLGGTDEEVLVPVTAGQELFVIVDGYTSSDFGTFTLGVEEIPPETTCDDLLDDDFNNLIDCADLNCKSDAACVPGSELVGAECSANTECASVAKDDPLCLSEALTSLPGGYCSEFCDLVADDCGTDGVCADFDLGGDLGVCLDACVDDGDCRNNYGCLDMGLSGNVCMPDSCQVGSDAVAGTNTGDSSQGFTSNKEASCIFGSADAKETVFFYTPPADGTLTITLTSDPVVLPDLGFSVRTDCADEATEVAGSCTDSNTASTPETKDVQVTGGVTYSIIVDGFIGDEGPFELDLELN